LALPTTYNGKNPNASNFRQKPGFATRRPTTYCGKREFELRAPRVRRPATKRGLIFGEMRRAEFSSRLHAPTPLDSTVEQSYDLLLNLRIVEETQKRLFKSFVLLCPFDLVFGWGAIFHPFIMRQGSSAERHGAVAPPARSPSKPGYPLFRSPAAMPLIVRRIPVTTSSSVSPAR
jgi:hypothetical protein